MAFEVTATEDFMAAFDEILEHFVKEGYPSSAAKLRDDFIELGGRLSVFPKIYPVYKNTHSNSDRDCRYTTLKNYVVLYTVDDEAETVVLEDIVSGKFLKR